MQKNELRIGNYISRLDLGNHSVRFEVIKELYKDKALTSGPFDVICEYEDITPIPLTEEWIERSGFENNGDFFILNDIRIYQYHNKFQSENFIFDFGLSNSYLEIEFFHELQNLYFILTGEELIIK